MKQCGETFDHSQSPINQITDKMLCDQMEFFLQESVDNLPIM